MNNHHTTRRGLAPLEFVLALPILLFIMALMVNFGTVACWKVRALNVARHALWSTRWPRSGATDPLPKFWPPTAGPTASGLGNAPMIDDPRVNQPVARGPLTGAVVNADLLDPTRGLREGSSNLTRGFAMLGKMGAYTLKANTVMLDDRWQYPQMGLWANRQRRIPVIYALQKAPAGLVNAYVQAAVAILRAPFREALKPLDRDDEFIFYGTLFGWGAGAPDFHPRLSGFCSLERPLADERVNELIDRIQGKVERDAEGHIVRRIPDLAERVTRAFIGLYQRAIRAYKELMSADPPPPPGEIAAMQAQIDQIQKKIDTLNQFLQTLQNTDGG